MHTHTYGHIHCRTLWHIIMMICIMHAHTYGHTHCHTHNYTHICKHTLAHTDTITHDHDHSHSHTHTHTHTRTHTNHTHTQTTHTHIYTYTRTHARTHTHTHTNTHTHTQTIHTHTHARTHAHTHTISSYSCPSSTCALLRLRWLATIMDVVSLSTCLVSHCWKSFSPCWPTSNIVLSVSSNFWVSWVTSSLNEFCDMSMIMRNRVWNVWEQKHNINLQGTIWVTEWVNVLFNNIHAHQWQYVLLL